MQQESAVAGNWLLRLENMAKSFGPVKALRQVNLQVKAGEVHALVGENGAGKSTLMKVLSGAHQPDSGNMYLDGREYKPHSPAAGRLAGIAMIYQELMLAPHLTVEENILLGLEKTKFGFLQNQKQKVHEALTWLGQENLRPNMAVNRLSIGKQQLVEIARALVTDARVVIMDEPTSSLTAADAQALFGVIRRLKEKGISVIYISHFLEEVFAVCDRYTVLRDGETVATGNLTEISTPGLIRHMIGRSVDELYPAIPHQLGETVLQVDSLVTQPYHKTVSFTLRRGEILGISGLVGAGRSEVIRSIFGLEKVRQGQVKIKGKPDLQAIYLNPNQALNADLDLLSENRKEEGLALNLSIATNLTLSALNKYAKNGLLNLQREQAGAADWMQQLQVKSQDPLAPISSLSGGNQQKVCIARLLHHNSDILFLDEPTRGIDVGSKAEIYRLIQTLAGQGKAIVVVSSYLPELLGICDTLGVMYRGQLSNIKPIKDWTEDDIMHFATSGVEAES
ncbi:sugar ABC transporter ATP-binding protein [Adhaeribacter aerolatus]|uniref:Sugar ABC transporter ATP-binding protein n=1 Tax=Adhaeribacter aerolatus TaxID=670289 RepID=A0A512AZT1_9BACT|nr:sugar ABC transporter ATP-binding protein [Adhaeribacter aerolatus]GEO05210.1 sugar ABC transporter ATP-binding protein [Adhaeribacter aerolatus]